MTESNGRVGGATRWPSLKARLEAKLVREGDCLVWTGGQNGRGYGQIGHNYKKKLVHRAAWELERGEIPEGMQVDHICHNTLCCNVTHLRLATPRQNLRNKSGARSNNLSGYRGVTSLANGRFRAKVFWCDRAYGHSWDTPEEAAAEVARLRKAFYGPFAGGD